MPSTRTVRTYAALAAGVLALSACGGTDAEDSSTSSGSSASGQGNVGAAESVTVEHAMGTADVKCDPKKVVTLGQGQTDSTLALGVTPVGVVKPWADDFYEYLPKEVNDAQVVGTELEPDLEAIAGLQPDLILGSKVRHEEFYPQLSAIAPTVFAETIGETWKDNVAVWAKTLCKDDKGEEVLSEYEKHADKVEKLLKDKAQTDVEASMIRFSPKHVRIYRTGFPGVVLKDAGFKRPETQQPDPENAPYGITNISEERIGDMDGDMVFAMVSDSKEKKGKDVMAEWEKNPLWGKLEAVQNDKVFIVNEDIWNLGGGVLSAHAMLDDLEKRINDAW